MNTIPEYAISLNIPKIWKGSNGITNPDNTFEIISSYSLNNLNVISPFFWLLITLIVIPIINAKTIAAVTSIGGFKGIVKYGATSFPSKFIPDEIPEINLGYKLAATVYENVPATIVET